MKIPKYETYINKETARPFVVAERTIKFDGRKNIDNPSAVFEVMRAAFNIDSLADEHVYILTADSKLKLTAIFEVSRGGQSYSPVPVKEILTKVLLVGASGFVVVHNHPSGELTPSEDDINITNRLKKACTICGLQLFDHIIIGNGYNSLREYGCLK